MLQIIFSCFEIYIIGTEQHLKFDNWLSLFKYMPLQLTDINFIDITFVEQKKIWRNYGCQDDFQFLRISKYLPEVFYVVVN